MKKTAILLLAALFIFSSGCKNEEIKESSAVTESEAKSIVVYLTKTGKCYHHSNCSCLSRSKIKKNLSEVAHKYRPCQLCFPPIIED